MEETSLNVEHTKHKSSQNNGMNNNIEKTFGDKPFQIVITEKKNL